MERWIALWVQLAVVLLCLLLGILFSKGKGAFLIAGYNTAGPEEKKDYDEKALCRFMGKLMFAIGGCYSLIALGTFLEQMALTWAGIWLILSLVIWAVIYANTENRFRKGK